MPRSAASHILRKGFTVATILGAVAAIVYGGMLAFLYLSQERLLFHATTLPGDYRFRFTQPFEEIRIPVPGAVLDALYFPHENAHGLVFFLHGNAGNLETWTTGLEFYRRVGYDLFMLDYRGYGKNFIVFENKGNSATNIIDMRGNTSHLPLPAGAEFDALRTITGISIMAPTAKMVISGSVDSFMEGNVILGSALAKDLNVAVGGVHRIHTFLAHA